MQGFRRLQAILLVLPVFIASTAMAIEWTEQEQGWIRKHPVIRVGMDPSWAPVSRRTQGRMEGIDPDLLDFLARTTGLKFEIDLQPNRWSEVYKKAVEGKLDMLAGTSKTEERLVYFSFSAPYANFPMGIVARENSPILGNLGELRGKVVALPSNYASTDYLLAQYPEIKPILVGNSESALQAVAEGKAQATVLNLVIASEIVDRRGFANLKLAGIAAFSFDLRYGVRKDWPELVNILNKGLDELSIQERQTIMDRWLSQPMTRVALSGDGWRKAIWWLGGAGILIVAVLIWNRSLKREVDRRRRIESELRIAKEEAESANRSKSEFLANVSHEIRTPMNAILGFTRLLKKELTDPKPLRYLESVGAACSALLTILNDILDLSKVEAGKLSLRYGPTDIRALLAGCCDLFAYKAEQKKLELEFNLPPDLPRYLLLDEVRIRQILFNILGNAIKFTDHGGIVLSASWRGDMARDDCGELILSVKDTGIGVAESEREQIFEAFFQSGSADSHRGGTGLGLAIAKRLAEIKGGRVEVFSELGKGSEFRFLFPDVKIAHPPSDRPLEVEETCEQFEPATILVADDHPSNRDLLASYLESGGHVVLTTKDGRESVETARREKPDLILLDVRMPGMDGPSAAAALKADQETAGIPIVFTSASAMTPENHALSQSGDAFLLKPVTPESLSPILRRFLKRKKGAHPALALTPSAKLELPGLVLSGEEQTIVGQILNKYDEDIQNMRMRGVSAMGNEFARLEISGIPVVGELLIVAAGEFDVEAVRRMVEQLRDATC